MFAVVIFFIFLLWTVIYELNSFALMFSVTWVYIFSYNLLKLLNLFWLQKVYNLYKICLRLQSNFIQFLQQIKYFLFSLSILQVSNSTRPQALLFHDILWIQFTFKRIFLFCNAIFGDIYPRGTEKVYILFLFTRKFWEGQLKLNIPRDLEDLPPLLRKEPSFQRTDTFCMCQILHGKRDLLI